MTHRTLYILFTPLLATSVQALEMDIYGQGHGSLDNVNDGQESSSYITSNSSRLGIKGSEAISDNLKAIFQLETGVDITAQGTNDGNGEANSEGQIFTKGRPTFIGLEGNFGKALIGHMPALDQWVNDYNLFADKVGDLGNLWEASGIPGRLDNVAYYQTPQFANINIALTHSPDEGEKNTSNTILKADYQWQTLKIGLALTTIGQGEDIKSHQAQAVTLQYDFGQFSIGGGFQNEDNIQGMEDYSRQSPSIGAKIRFASSHSLSLQYATSITDKENANATQIAISYDYQLSKNAVLYAAYAMMDNEENVRFSVNGKGHGDKVEPAFGDDPKAFSLGFVYKFEHALSKI